MTPPLRRLAPRSPGVTSTLSRGALPPASLQAMLRRLPSGALSRLSSQAQAAASRGDLPALSEALRVDYKRSRDPAPLRLTAMAGLRLRDPVARAQALKMFHELDREVSCAPPPSKPMLSLQAAVSGEEMPPGHDDLVPVDFAQGVLRVARSVALIRVPCLDDDGKALMSGDGSTPRAAMGTAWLLTPRHIITNFHVINARGEDSNWASASDAALDAQWRNAEVFFDYESGQVPTGAPRSIDTLVVASRHAMAAPVPEGDLLLDYAVLRLSAPAPDDRPGLRIRGSAVSARDEFGDPVAANIVQHPAGGCKQLGIRDNCVADVSADAVSYYTDTFGGSSGSPVMTDGWEVFALHLATDAESHERPVNYGVPLAKIVDDLVKRYRRSDEPARAALKELFSKMNPAVDP